MTVNIKGDALRVVILSIAGLYTQIYDELYCTEDRYQEILSEFGNSDEYKIVLI